MNDLVIFRLGPSKWALPTDRVHQVLAPRPVTRLPDPPPLVRGLIAWRARVLPVFVLGERLGCEDPPTEQCALLVTEVKDEWVALAVDEVIHLTQPAEPGVELLNLERVLNER